ncbi:MAG: PKD domain-containing protein [Planctomycetota bacterium]
MPVAVFSAAPLNGPAPLTVQFTDASTGRISTWRWDFNNDGVIDSTARNPLHTYNTPGYYSVKLTVVGPYGTGEDIKNNLIIVNTKLEISSEYGNPNPPAGTRYYAPGGPVAAFIEQQISLGTGIRARCTGFSGTGSVPVNGDENSISFSIQTNSSLTWNWQVEYEVVTEVTPQNSGTLTIFPESTDEYYASESMLTLQAVPNQDYWFDCWSGDLNGNINPATLTVDSPKDIMAEFSRWKMLNTSLLSPRSGHTAVWTGTEIIIWGGYTYSDQAYYLSNGAKYCPETDTWTMLAACPVSGRCEHTAIWTGTEMIIWGGYCHDGSAVYLQDGAKYNPASDTWTVISLSPLLERWRHTAVWTGTEMIVWGGYGNAQYYADGASYNPENDTWTMIESSPLSNRNNHTAVWTGSGMIVWGGYGAGLYFSNGASYNPDDNTWSVISNAPISARENHTAIWTGTEMIIWGGYNMNSRLADGARYNPLTNTWVVLRQSPLFGRYNHSAVWTGSRMVIWGGHGSGDAYFNDGAHYTPASDTWTMLGDSILSGRCEHSALWIEDVMIIWGGISNEYYNDGAVCAP